MNKITDTTNIGITFQMTLDTFLDELHPVKTTDKQSYEYALQQLEEMKQYRNPKTKYDIAQRSLQTCPYCIESYLALGRYHQDIYERMRIYKEGMELATMNLGKEFFQQNTQDFYNISKALPLLHIKYAYACTLYELGYMRKSKQQFEELLNLNPNDHFHARHFLFSLYLYFEEVLKCKEILDKYEKDTFHIYTEFLLKIKLCELEEAKHMFPILKSTNSHLFDVLTYKAMNIATFTPQPTPGSVEEANYIYRILVKAIQSQEYLHIFMSRYPFEL